MLSMNHVGTFLPARHGERGDVGVKPDPAIPRDPQSEDLVACMDFGQVLEPHGQVRITAAMREKAARLRTTIRAEIRRFLRRSELEGERDLPAFDYDAAMANLTELDVEQRIVELTGALQGGEEPGVVVVAGRAIKYLRGILPVRSRITVTGPTPIPPSDFVRYKFRRGYAVVEDPLEVFRDMNEGNLSRDQTRTLQTIYPSLYEEGERALFEEMAIMKGENPKLEFSRDKVRQIENLWLTRSWTPELAKAMQAAFSQPEPKAQAPKPLGNAPADASATPIQRIEAK